MLMLIGIDIVRGSLGPLVAAAFVAVLIDRKYIVVEEQVLAVRFGSQ